MTRCVLRAVPGSSREHVVLLSVYKALKESEARALRDPSCGGAARSPRDPAEPWAHTYWITDS